MAPMSSVAALVFLSFGRLSASYDVEVISDITAPSPSLDAGRALEIKKQEFWEPVLHAASGQEVQGHAALYKDAEAAIEKLCLEHTYVRVALREALERLRRADAAVLAQAEQHSLLAAEELATPVRSTWGESFSFITGGQNFLGQAVQRFLDGGDYTSRLRGHMEQRKASVLPALQGASTAAGDVLGDCRFASKRGFDAPKHDVCDGEAEPTPEAAKDIANRIIDAAAETRRRFMKMVAASADGLTNDSERQHEEPSAIVTQTLLAGMEEPAAAPSGAEELRINLF